MHLVFDIFQGLGMGAAVGIRPFLPTLAVGGLAAANAEIDFNGTNYSFLQSAPFLLGILILAVLLGFLERRRGHRAEEPRPLLVALGLFAGVLGALLFAGSLARGHYAAWPGWIGGALCATVGLLATRPLLTRVRARLDAAAAAAVPLYAEGAAVLLAALSVLVAPVGLVGLLFLLWLLVAGRRREGRKYAGLRILR